MTVSRLLRAVPSERELLPDLLVAALWTEREQREIAQQCTAKYAVGNGRLENPPPLPTRTLPELFAHAWELVSGGQRILDVRPPVLGPPSLFMGWGGLSVCAGGPHPGTALAQPVAAPVRWNGDR
ncbi:MULTISPECIES: hypothetical protein [Streptomyces]|uniref:hypothetical protein n=1 Tax=Streptomyces TaxID=1883 RepID=UPI00135F1232|nr:MULTISPECIES: hypothetical protein [unclassified Streptomyces]MDN5382607.1 hypothetical protein [Streptomyces sp. LB8]